MISMDYLTGEKGSDCPEIKYGIGRRLAEYAYFSHYGRMPPFVGKFPSLQQHNLMFLTNQLAELEARAHNIEQGAKYLDLQETKALSNMMHTYVQAIRDMEYLNQLPVLSESMKKEQWGILSPTFDKIYSNEKSFMDATWVTIPDLNQQRLDAVLGLFRWFIPSFVPKMIKRLSGKNSTSRHPDWPNTSYMQDLLYEYNSDQLYYSLLRRIANYMLVSVLAVACGASLIVPMVIMVLDPSLTKSLVTTSVAVTIFGFVVGIWDKKNVMSLTSAYAAVLVVFVGLGGSP